MGGRFDIRPAGAAPLFDSNSGKAAARRRWDRERENTEKSVVAYASKLAGEEVTLEEAINLVVNLPQFKKSMEGHTAAAKFVAQKLDVLPGGGEAQQIDARSVSINVYQLDRPSATRYLEHLKSMGEDDIAAVVEAQIGEGEGPFEIRVPVE